MTLLPNPTPFSNWVICRRLIQGAVPGFEARRQGNYEETVASFCNMGITTFISLLEPKEDERLTKRHRHYTDIIKEKSPKTKFIKYPIPDGDVADDEKIKPLIRSIAQTLKTTRDVFYIHCMAGIGRSATICALVLVELGMSSQGALHHVQEMYNTRPRTLKYNSTKQSPSTSKQFQQVYRWSKVD